MIMAALRSEDVFIADEHYSSPFEPLFANYRQDILTSSGYSAIPDISSTTFGRGTEDQYASQSITSFRTDARQSSFDVSLATFFDTNPVTNDKLSLYDSSGITLQPSGVASDWSALGGLRVDRFPEQKQPHHSATHHYSVFEAISPTESEFSSGHTSVIPRVDHLKLSNSGDNVLGVHFTLVGQRNLRKPSQGSVGGSTEKDSMVGSLV